MADDVQGLDKLVRKLQKMAAGATNLRTPLQAVGQLILASIMKNFQSQGRPVKWKPLAPATIRARRKGKRGKGGPQILVNTGTLRNSFAVSPGADSVAVGTNIIYARRQNFGYDGPTKSGRGKKKSKVGRGHAKTPARVFVMLQDDDVSRIGNVFKRAITD